MAPFGDGDGGAEVEGGGDARRGWDPLRSGSAPPTMEGSAAAALAAEGMSGVGGGPCVGSFFSGMDGLGARLDKVSRQRGAVSQECFVNSASLYAGPPGLLYNGMPELEERQLGLSRDHSVFPVANYSAFDAGSLWSDKEADNAEFRRHVQNRFMANMNKMNKMNTYGTRDLDAPYLSESDFADAFSGLRLSNSTVMDGRNREEVVLDEMLQHRQELTKLCDDNRSHLDDNLFCRPRPECLDVRSPLLHGDGILQRQTSTFEFESPNVSRMGRHHVMDIDHLSVAEQLAIMGSGNLHRNTSLFRNASMSNIIHPMRDRCNITDFDMIRSRKTFLDDILAQQYLQDESRCPSIPGFPYKDSRIYHEEPCFPYSRMQRSGSRFHPNSGYTDSHGDRQSRHLPFSRKATGRNMGSQVYHDNSLLKYLEVPLDNTDRNGVDSLELVNVVGHVKEVSMDQYGSRFIQQKLESASAEDREKIFPEILSNAIALTTDVFGNYVIQKFFEFATESQLTQLSDQLKGHILELSLQMYGCRVIQKVLEVVDMDRKIDIVLELKDYVLKCIADQNGNHVIQKCIECVHEDRIPFVIEPILSQILGLCTHQYGCRVIQRVLEHCNDPATQSAIMNEIAQHTFRLTDDKFGNYVVQHVLEHGKPEERSSIIQKLSGQVVILSKQKFASNVIEKCLTFGTPEERDGLIGEIISSGQIFQELMKDQFGNYVVQRVLQTCDDKYLEMILSSIKLHLNELKNYTYGKHIVARMEKLIVTGERRARTASMSCQNQQSPYCTDVDAKSL